MKGSLRLRLVALAVMLVALALLLAWVALTVLFERHLARRFETELTGEILALAGALEPEGERLALAAEPGDPRFQRPFGGLYWQVEGDGRPLLSRSLWDKVLDTQGREDGVAYTAPGPQETVLIALTRAFTVETESGQRTARVTAAMDRAELAALSRAFGRELGLALSVIGLVLTAAATLQVGLGLKPLDRLRGDVAAVRSGAAERLDTSVPDEVLPLVAEVNDLLDAQKRSLDRARASASDLAHGLKTPLTVLGAVAHALFRAGSAEPARQIAEQVEVMRRRVDRQLARARLGADRLASSDLAFLLERLFSAMRHLPRGADIAWEADMPAGLRVPLDETDLAEAIGNLLDNARKWARSRVRVSAARQGGAVEIRIEDDGPGVPQAARATLTGRGVRLDDDAEGAGLGLAIVADILEAYGGSLAIAQAPAGGLSVRLSVPASHDAAGRTVEAARKAA